MIEIEYHEDGTPILPDDFSIMSTMRLLKKTKEQKTALNSKVKDLNVEIANLEQAIRAFMSLPENDGMQSLSSGALTASQTSEIVPQVEDWDQFEAFVYAQKTLFLFQRRLSATAYRELLELNDGQDIPGVKPFEKKGISLRKNQYKGKK